MIKQLYNKSKSPNKQWQFLEHVGVSSQIPASAMAKMENQNIWVVVDRTERPTYTYSSMCK